jgi:hypothetical protein
MNEIFVELFIAGMYVGTILGMSAFLGIVCRLGDLGFWIIGWIDSKLQERHMDRLEKAEDFPFAYGPPGVSKSSMMIKEVA